MTVSLIWCKIWDSELFLSFSLTKISPVAREMCEWKSGLESFGREYLPKDKDKISPYV